MMEREEMLVACSSEKCFDDRDIEKDCDSKQRDKIINMVIIGKTGNGKSATGNTILERDVFAIRTLLQLHSITDSTDIQTKEQGDTLIRIVDTPGLMDTEKEPTELLLEICKAMSMCTEGFDAILLVFRADSTFTKEDLDTVSLLKRTFGDNFIKDHGIIIMTRGDVIDELDHETDKQKAYRQYIRGLERPPELVNILKECENRVVLFFNSKKTPIERIECRKELLKIIGTIKSRYTSELFSAMSEERAKLSEELKLPAQHQFAQDDLSILEQYMEELISLTNDARTNCDTQVTELHKKRITAYYDKIIKRLSLLEEKAADKDKFGDLLKCTREYRREFQDIRDKPFDEQSEKQQALLKKTSRLKNAGSALINSLLKIKAAKILAGGALVGAGVGAGFGAGVGALFGLGSAPAVAIGATGGAAVGAVAGLLTAGIGAAVVAATCVVTRSKKD